MNESETTSQNVVPIESYRTKRRATVFVPTHTSKAILDALAYTTNEDDLAVIYGEPGVGKTRTVHHFKSQLEESKNAHAWLTTISPSISTVVPMLTAIAKTVGVVAHESGARNLHDAICQRLATTRRAILIIDESQHLKRPALEELRSLHDTSGCAVALVGNEEVYRRLSQHPQLHSRVGVKLKLARPHETDVHDLVRSRWGSADDETLEMLDQISQLPGALRLVVKVMNASSKSRTTKGVRSACRMLGVDLGGGVS